MTDNPRRFIQSLADGDTVDEIYLVSDKQLRANRNGNLYLQMDLRDRTGVINARLWNATEKQFNNLEPGDFVAVRGKVQHFQGGLQMILNGLEKVGPEQVNIRDFLPHTPMDVGKLRQSLQAALRKMSNPHLRALAECYFMDAQFMNGFGRAPAGIRNHHAYIGGLLEHVVNMLEVAERVLPLYPRVDRDLLLMGVFLHDSGKVQELGFERNFGYTDEGQLIGHMVLGVEMLTEKIAAVPELTGEPFPRELALRLKHMILSHHGALEFGSPVLPMTPEAIALHYIDNLDAKVHTFARDIEEDRNTTAWTPYNPSLERRLYKGGRNGTVESEEEG